jgi:hypothetical protein
MGCAVQTIQSNKEHISPSYFEDIPARGKAAGG